MIPRALPLTQALHKGNEVSGKQGKGGAILSSIIGENVGLGEAIAGGFGMLIGCMTNNKPVSCFGTGSCSPPPSIQHLHRISASTWISLGGGPKIDCTADNPDCTDFLIMQMKCVLYFTPVGVTDAAQIRSRWICCYGAHSTRRSATITILRQPPAPKLTLSLTCAEPAC